MRIKAYWKQAGQPPFYVDETERYSSIADARRHWAVFHIDSLGRCTMIPDDELILTGADTQAPINSGTMYVYHRGTDTYIAVDECELINVPDDIPGDEIEEYLWESEGQRLVDRLKEYNQ